MQCQLKSSAYHSGTKAFGCCPVHNLGLTAPRLMRLQCSLGLWHRHLLLHTSRITQVAMPMAGAPAACPSAVWSEDQCSWYRHLPLTPAVLAALVALRPKTCHQCLLLTYSQGTPTSTEHTPGPRLAASATGIPALPGPDAHTLVSASTLALCRVSAACKSPRWCQELQLLILRAFFYFWCRCLASCTFFSFLVI